MRDLFARMEAAPDAQSLNDDVIIPFAAALEEVSIPTLLLSLVHITGDPRFIRDYKQALATSSRSSRPMTDDFLGIARSYARMGKLKDAAKWIKDAPVSYMQLRALAKEPAFAELAAHPRYREEVFRLGD